ncbi:hypothetical protein KAR91_49790 [Candidatus Pacearchaeota archaeon]|nr:hypothetical protein [Candidatus Pacearchaeota archaeon]
MRLGLIFFTVLMMGSTTGCGMLGTIPKIEMTIDQQITIIKSTARTAVYAALTETTDNDVELAEKANKLKAPIEADVLPLLYDGTVTFDTVTIQLLERKIDRRYMFYLSPAMIILQLYYEVPDVGEIMTPDDVALWVAFFEGIVQGSNDALTTID